MHDEVGDDGSQLGEFYSRPHDDVHRSKKCGSYEMRQRAAA
jgi:hypothetical protein